MNRYFNSTATKLQQEIAVKNDFDQFQKMKG
jgi:hypothetical protein